MEASEKLLKICFIHFSNPQKLSKNLKDNLLALMFYTLLLEALNFHSTG